MAADYAGRAGQLLLQAADLDALPDAGEIIQSRRDTPMHVFWGLCVPRGIHPNQRNHPRGLPAKRG